MQVPHGSGASDQHGRGAVIGELVDRLTAPARRSVVLRGPAGIGKSHIANSVADRLLAETGRVAVRRVYGGESQQFLDFGALLHLLPLDAPPVAAEFELVLRLRRSLVEQAVPTVVVVDDVGTLDRKSAAVLEGVLRAGDVVVLATERTAPDGQRDDDHHLSSALSAYADPVLVAPLGRDALSRLLDDWEGPGELGSVRRLVAMSEGNPLALRELLQSARSSEAISQSDGLWHLADFAPGGSSLEHLVELHLRRLSESEWDLLRAIAIAGNLPRAVLVRLDVAALERLERAELVSGDPTRLDHPLYAEVIRHQLSGEETRRLYSKLASAVALDDGVDPARLAEWTLDAGAGIDDRTARSGAAVAIGRWENRLAQRLIHSIVEPTVVDLVHLVWALANAGDLDEATSIADRAVEAATTEMERVDAGLALAELWSLQLGRSDEGYEHLLALRATLTDVDQMARVDGATALFMRMTGKGPLAEPATDSAVAIDATTDAARLSVAIANAFGEVFAGRYDAAGPFISTGYELAELLQEPHNTVRLAITDALRNLLSGRLDRAEEIVENRLQSADISLVRPAHAVWIGLAAQTASLRGDHAQAALRGREAVRAADHVDDIGAGGFVRGELRAALVEIGLDVTPDPLESPLGRARAELRLMGDSEVDAAAAALVRSGIDAGYLLWAPFIGLEAVRHGPAPRTSALVADLCAAHDGPLAAAIRDFAVGNADDDGETLARAATGFGAVGADTFALDALSNELEVNRSAGVDLFARRRRGLLARSIVSRLRPHPSPRAAARLARISADLDLPSDRQLEIAHLVATGRSSKQVAAELIVSARTVDNHLAAVYRNLGISSRAELAQLPF